jgi:predicted GIY-YIG superfamily endonuclease
VRFISPAVDIRFQARAGLRARKGCDIDPVTNKKGGVDLRAPAAFDWSELVEGRPFCLAEAMPFHVYMLRCRDGTLYVGHADDLDMRLAEHEAGTFGDYTGRKLPVTLVWTEEFPTLRETLAAERRIKGWSRVKKMALIRRDCRTFALLRHPATSSGAIGNIEVHVRRTGDILRLTYALTGQTRHIRIPAPAPPERRDGLWRTTCFEAFLGHPGGSYSEYNFSPSGEWAAYSFSGYRAGMAPLDVAPPAIGAEAAEDRLGVHVSLSTPPSCRLALAAVIEEADGTISYWALAHPAAKPDFHHPDSFVHEIR